MNDFFHVRFQAIYLLVMIFLVPQLSFSQKNQENPVGTNTTDLFDLEPIAFDSHGATLHGYFCRAHGEGIHPTIILLHGSPGGNRDVLGLAQAIPRSGWNALVFNYRGFHESEGMASLNHSVEDVFSASDFLKSKEMVTKYRTDTNNIAVAGWSYGGDIALTAAANNPSVKYVISIAAADLSEIARLARKSEEFREMFVQEINDRSRKGLVKSHGGKEQLRELLEDSDKYDLVKHAGKLSEKSILIIGGWKDQYSTIEGHVLPLIRSLQQEGAENTDIVIFDTNHSFEGKETELADAITEWLTDHHPGGNPATKRTSEPGILKYIRVYSDSIGESHLEDLEMNLDEIDFAPPAPPIYTSDLISSTRCGFLSVLPGWEPVVLLCIMQEICHAIHA
jgi:dipeptidyl aminopeptidase/acylaminoacyl peptidase